MVEEKDLLGMVFNGGMYDYEIIGINSTHCSFKRLYSGQVYTNYKIDEVLGPLNRGHWKVVRKREPIYELW